MLLFDSLLYTSITDSYNPVADDTGNGDDCFGVLSFLI